VTCIRDVSSFNTFFNSKRSCFRFSGATCTSEQKQAQAPLVFPDVYVSSVQTHYSLRTLLHSAAHELIGGAHHHNVPRIFALCVPSASSESWSIQRKSSIKKRRCSESSCCSGGHCITQLRRSAPS
jgi:hypothetical protein